MSFSASLTYVPDLLPSTFILRDTSNYAAPDSKSNISSRTVTLLDSNGDALPGFTNPIAFPYGGGDDLTITGLTNDLALQAIMTLVPISPQSGSTYTAEAEFATQRFLQVGLFNIQVQAQNNPSPTSLANVQYRTNSIDIIIEAQNSQTAVLYSNLTGAQICLDRGQQIINNTQL